MKSLTLILTIIGLTFMFEHAHAQFGYSNEYDTKEGVNIKRLSKAGNRTQSRLFRFFGYAVVF